MVNIATLGYDPRPRMLLLPLLLVALAILNVGCTDAPQSSNAMIFKGVFKEDARTLDPVRASDPAAVILVSSLFETLFQYAYTTQEFTIEPLLAADMPTVSKDRLTVTIPVRNDVRFKDDLCFRDSSGKGRHMTARDLVYAILRTAQPELESPGWWLLEGRIKGLNQLRAQLESLPKESRSKAVVDAQVEGLRDPD